MGEKEKISASKAKSVLGINHFKGKTLCGYI